MLRKRPGRLLNPPPPPPLLPSSSPPSYFGTVEEDDEGKSPGRARERLTGISVARCHLAERESFPVSASSVSGLFGGPLPWRRACLPPRALAEDLLSWCCLFITRRSCTCHEYALRNFGTAAAGGALDCGTTEWRRSFTLRPDGNGGGMATVTTVGVSLGVAS